MEIKELLQAGKLEESLVHLQDQVRQSPADPKLRTFLFQLLAVLGQWDRAETQLKVLADLTAETMLLSRIFEPVIQCERVRSAVFAGQRTPTFFGEPEEWMGLLVQAHLMVARQEFAAAAQLRSQALEAAPPSAGTLNGEAFSWIADADSRMGPVIEAVVNGNYYWVPFCRIQKIESTPPEDLRDLVWLPVQFTWSNGGTAPGHIPARYPGTDASGDGPLRLSRKTDWRELPGETYLGLGQRILNTDANEYPLLQCRTIEITPAVIEAAPAG
jgi:type VI secretion system protein ImpE